MSNSAYGNGRAPLLDALISHSRKRLKPFHFPGHKAGRGADREFSTLMGRGAMAIDLTELPGLDDLHSPRGPILEAERLASELNGADTTFFLVNGSTVGIHAMVMASCAPGDEIILARDVHRAFVGAVVLSGALPVFISPEIHPRFSLSMGVTIGAVSRALSQYPRARAVGIVSPNYYGICAPVDGIVREVKRYGKIMLVDQAHGSHLRFMRGGPSTALLEGADAVVESTHKTMGSLTGTAMLHLKGDFVDRARVKRALRILQTSSPSYILLASLDAARRRASVSGYEDVSRACRLASRAREAINALPGLHCLTEDDLEEPAAGAGFRLDPTRLVVSVSGLGLNGWQAEEILRKHHGIQVEFADEEHVILVITLADEGSDIDALISAMEDLGRARAVRGPGSCHRLRRLLEQAMVPPPLRVPPREAFFAPSRPVEVSRSAGMISAEEVAIYPPGIVIIWPGEEIVEPAIEYLLRACERGARLQGLDDPTGRHIRVVAGPSRG
ncbi:MAG TPA: arginine decarboxylase [Firmicutes bacterium]|nr:arginine decarboxylase [Bacillota bacterium]